MRLALGLVRRLRGVVHAGVFVALVPFARVPCASVPLASVPLAVGLLAGGVVGLAPGLAHAQAPGGRGGASSKAELRLSADANVVGLGEVLQLTFSAMTTNAGDVSDPEPGATKGFSVVGKSVAPQTSISIVNGVMTQRRGVTVTWMLKATQVGTYSLGPATVSVDGQRQSSNPLSVQVVPAGQAPPRRPSRTPFPGSPFSPFDPWKDLFNFPGDDDARPFVDPIAPPMDPRFALEAPRGAGAFLHAVVDKKRAVVGEQVTYTAYLYVDPQTSNPKWNDEHDTSTPDFLKYPLFKDDEVLKRVGFANVGGQPWAVYLFRRYALFPIKAGDLEIGPMSMALSRRGGGQRESERLVVRVTEPPLQGRPPGYAVGDVGSFKLSASVDPRQVPQGGAVGVTVTLSGTGNLPTALVPPARPGADWVAPEVRDKVGPLPGERYGGERVFSYVVRLTKPGALDLGSFTLPYWDPATRSYAVAQADLGSVEVTPAPAASAGTPGAAGSAEPASPPTEVLAGLPAPLARREGASSATTPITDRAFFWASLLVPSLAWAFFSGGQRIARRVRKAQSERDASPERELKERIAAADVACRGSDPKLGDAAIARVLETATVAYLSMNVRGIPADQVFRALEERGVPSADAKAFGELLSTCGRARFAPEAGDMAAVRGRWAEAQTILRALERVA